MVFYNNYVCVCVTLDNSFYYYKSPINVNINVNVYCIIFKTQFHSYKNFLTASVKPLFLTHTHTVLNKNLYTGKNVPFYTLGNLYTGKPIHLNNYTLGNLYTQKVMEII